MDAPSQKGESEGLMARVKSSFRWCYSKCRGKRENEAEMKTVSLFTGYFFFINYIVGTGFLGLPYAFYFSGILAGMLTLMVVSFISYNTANWTVEAMARAQALTTVKEEREETKQLGETTDNPSMPVFEIKLNRKFEPSEMCEVFFGRYMKIIYIIVLSLYIYMAAWSFTTVAGSAWASNLPFNTSSLHRCEFDDFNRVLLPVEPGCVNTYRLCVFMYGVIVVILSLIELTDQKILQIIFGILRFVTMGGMILYCIVKVAEAHGESPHNATEFQNSTVLSLGDAFTHFDGRAWLVAVPVFVYSQITHQGIPSLSAPIKAKKHLGHFLRVIFVSTFVVYTAVGVFVAMYWQDTIQETSTLNWVPLAKMDGHLALQILSYYIVLFPSLDVISAYPLVVLTIANNLYLIFTGKDADSDKRRYAWALKLLLKFISAILPLISGLFIANLVNVLQFAGLLGFLVCYLFPTLFQLGSQYQCLRLFGNSTAGDNEDSETEDIALLQDANRKTNKDLCRQWWLTYKNPVYWTSYSTPFSHPIGVVVMATVAFMLFLLTIASIVLSIEEHATQSGMANATLNIMSY